MGIGSLCNGVEFFRFGVYSSLSLLFFLSVVELLFVGVCGSSSIGVIVSVSVRTIFVFWFPLVDFLLFDDIELMDMSEELVSLTSSESTYRMLNLLAVGRGGSFLGCLVCFEFFLFGRIYWILRALTFVWLIVQLICLCFLVFQVIRPVFVGAF